MLLFDSLREPHCAAANKGWRNPPDVYLSLVGTIEFDRSGRGKVGPMRRGIVPMQIHLRVACGALLLAVLAPVLAGCDEPTSARAATEIVPGVGIVTIKSKPRALVRELPGRIAPTRLADVRPRISGIVVERLFQHGSEVKAGDALYRIDQRPLEVELLANEAALAKANAAFDLAAQQARRIATLASQNAVSEAEHEKATGAMRQARSRCRRAARPMSRAHGSI